MKKRLLITSIVMMLVVAVALSTATYAWFTQNATVSASTITLTADTNQAPALGIGWAGGEASSAIAFDVAGTLKPMAPVELTADSTTAAGTVSTVVFNTATTREESNLIVFNKPGENVATATPTVYGNGSVNAFYIKNLSPSNSISKVTVSAVFTTENSEAGNDMIRVAIFTKDASEGASAASAYTLLGVLGQTASTPTMIATDGADTFNKNTTYYVRSGSEGNYTYAQTSIADAAAFATAKALGTLCTFANTAVYGADGLYDDGDAVKDLSHYINVKTSLDIVTTRTSGSTNLAAGYEVDMVAVVWLDGTELTDSRQSQVGTVSLSFTAA